MLQNLPAAGIGLANVSGGTPDIIVNSLAFVRSHLDMEIAYLSEFVGEDLVFRAVDAPGLEDLVAVGGTVSLNETYCRHILESRLPELIPDTDDVAFTKSIPLTKALPIRAHVSVPIRRADGSVYGMFCCLSREPRLSLNSRDLEVMRAFAALSSDQVNRRMSFENETRTKREAIEAILDGRTFDIALQPIKRLMDQSVAGYEALCRFSPMPYRPPNLWFDDASEVGLQSTLELSVIEVALTILSQMPNECYLALNSSPGTLASGEIAKLLDGYDGARVLIEITEHAAIDDLDILLMEIDRLRDLGARIAVDDAGAGYSGLQQIIRLRPDVIKLDMSLTQNVDKDVARRALASAMVQFAHDTSARVVAEGIETEAELRTLKNIGVELGQGYHLGRPALHGDVLDPKRRA